nr:MAG TPA: hypothetical protein [Microviridae sp.]
MFKIVFLKFVNEYILEINVMYFQIKHTLKCKLFYCNKIWHYTLII